MLRHQRLVALVVLAVVALLLGCARQASAPAAVSGSGFATVSANDAVALLRSIGRADQAYLTRALGDRQTPADAIQWRADVFSTTEVVTLLEPAARQQAQSRTHVTFSVDTFTRFAGQSKSAREQRLHIKVQYERRGGSWFLDELSQQSSS